MKKIILMGIMIITLGLSGCGYYFDSDGVHTLANSDIDEKYMFEDYDSFENAISKINGNSDIFFIDKYEEVKTSKVDEVEASVVFENVKVIREKRDNVKIHYIGIFDLTSNEQEPEYTIETGKTFVYKVNWKKLIGKSNAMMLIYLPTDYHGDFSLSTVSGDTEIDNLDLDNINIKTVSGDLDYREIQSENIGIKTVSGEISGYSIYGNDISVESVSGDFDATSVKCENLKVKSVSGSCEISEVQSERFSVDSTSGTIEIDVLISGFIEVGTVSGDVEFGIDDHRGDIKIKTISGKVDIAIKGKMNTKFDINLNTGDINCDYDFDKVDKKDENDLNAEIGSGKYLLKINTVSGDVTLK